MIFFSRYFSTKSIYLYFGVLIVCNLYFFSRALPLIWWFFGLVEVVGFFYYSNLYTRVWTKFTEKSFLSKLFKTALIIRIIWVIFSYFFYIIFTGIPFEIGSADAQGYHNEGMWVADMISTGDINSYFEYINGKYSDMGYPLYLGCQYFITWKSILIARLIKAFLSAYTCVLVYKVSKSNMGDEVAKMAAVFCMLMPNLIYYTGLHTKEVEMVFLTVLFIERSDFLLRVRSFNFINLFMPILIALILFFFRTVLGTTAIFALFSGLLFTSNKIMVIGKRWLLIIWMVIAGLYLVGSKISTEVEQVWNARQINQVNSIKFRTERINGNTFAKYASSAIFVPMIFVLPFPTLIYTPNQENQQMINGGNYVKNIMSFFLLLAIYWVVVNNKWRDYILLGTFTIGYLLVISLSAFAQSERFHQPALPFILVMAAFGVSKVTNKHKLYFKWYMILIFFAIIGWSYFKLAGRGLA